MTPVLSMTQKHDSFPDQPIIPLGINLWPWGKMSCFCVFHLFLYSCHSPNHDSKFIFSQPLLPKSVWIVLLRQRPGQPTLPWPASQQASQAGKEEKKVSKVFAWQTLAMSCFSVLLWYLTLAAFYYRIHTDLHDCYAKVYSLSCRSVFTAEIRD